MTVNSCIPVIPSSDLEKSLRLWVDGLGFERDSEMWAEDRLIFCMLHKGDLCFMLNQRAGTPLTPDTYEGICLYWNPIDIHETRERLIQLGYVVSDISERDYGQTEFFMTDDDGYSHCFGVPTKIAADRGGDQAIRDTHDSKSHSSSRRSSKRRPARVAET